MNARVAAILAAVALLGGCGGGGPAAQPPGASTTPEPTPSRVPPVSIGPSPTSPTGTPSGSPSGPPAAGSTRISKVLVVLVENHSLDAMRRQMPWTARLGARYGYAVGYRGITHPSLPNYLAISGGDTFGVTDDRDPSAHPVRGPSVFGQALARGETARVYAEGMAGTCGTTGSRYAVRHNPWVYYVDERAACRRYDVPLTTLASDAAAGNLPSAGMVVPDLCHDAHDCPAATADAWLKPTLRPVLRGPDFLSGRLLVVVTADEDERDQGNLVLTTLANPQLHHRVVTAPLDHYSLARLYAEVVGATPLRRARSAASLSEAFGLLVGP